jgi:predicted metal-dependent RNase
MKKRHIVCLMQKNKINVVESVFEGPNLILYITHKYIFFLKNMCEGAWCFRV